MQARHLRGAMTDSEHALWQRLRGGQLGGSKFRRQHPFPPYVVDFFCERASLVIEIDGAQHTPLIDGARTRFLESKGVRILRFHSDEVLLYMDAVLEAIVNHLEIPTLTPTPLPAGEGLKSEGTT